MNVTVMNVVLEDQLSATYVLAHGPVEKMDDIPD